MQRFDVKIEAVALRKAAAAPTGGAASPPQWVPVAIARPFVGDLLALRNGVRHELSAAPIPSGEYAGVRVQIASVSVTAAGVTTVLDVGAGAVDIDYPFAYEAGDVTELVVDFDAAASLVPRVDGTFQLVPVLKVKGEVRY